MNYHPRPTVSLVVTSDELRGASVGVHASSLNPDVTITSFEIGDVTIQTSDSPRSFGDALRHIADEIEAAEKAMYAARFDEVTTLVGLTPEAG